MKIKKIKGEIKGIVIKGILSYIQRSEKKENIEKLKQSLKKDGLEIIWESKIKSFEWYPLSWYIILLTKSQEILEWKEEEIFQIGYQAAKHSLIAKIFLKHFTSIEKAAQTGKNMWKQMVSVGDLSIKKLDTKNKKIIFKIENFDIHPLVCTDIKGYMKSMGEFMVGQKNVKIKETKCSFQGDAYHEFELDWE